MKVKFLPMDIELEIKPNQSIMSLAHENDINILSVCNGMPSCAECRVRVIEGDHNLVPPSTKELSLIGTGYFIDQRRLSCQCLCFGNVTVDLSEQIEKASEAKVNKKFLKRAQIENPEDSYSEGGILIEQDDDFDKVSVDKKERIKPQSEGALSKSSKSSKRSSRRGEKNSGDANAKSKSPRSRGSRRRRRPKSSGNKPSS